MTAKRILNATSGESEVFSPLSGEIDFKLQIVGVAGSPIQAFVDRGSKAGGTMYLKIKGLTGSGVTVKLNGKSDSPDDTTFDNTATVFSEDFQGYYYTFTS